MLIQGHQSQYQYGQYCTKSQLSLHQYLQLQERDQSSSKPYHTTKHKSNIVPYYSTAQNLQLHIKSVFCKILKQLLVDLYKNDKKQY